MAFSPITSWQIDGETVETVADFILGGSKITADGECSHEIKRRLLFGRKAMTNLDSIIKSRDVSLSTKWKWSESEVAQSCPTLRPVDCDCSYEIKRHLLLGRKAMSNLDKVLKIRDITLLTKVHIFKAMVFPLVKQVQMWKLDHKEGRALPKINAFELCF